MAGGGGAGGIASGHYGDAGDWDAADGKAERTGAQTASGGDVGVGDDDLLG